eukprot:gene1350-biopygen8603
MLLKVDEKDWDKADVTPAIVEYLKFGLRRLGISAESAKPGETSDTVWKIRKVRSDQGTRRKSAAEEEQYELFAGLLQVLKPELPTGTKVVVVAETPPESPRSQRSSSSSDGNGSSDACMSILALP